MSSTDLFRLPYMRVSMEGQGYQHFFFLNMVSEC